MPSRTTYWRCNSCWETSEEHQLLRASNPFDAAADEIVGCPQCKEADDFMQACDFMDNDRLCGKQVSSGTPTPNGGYVHRCLNHGPHHIGFSEAETTPVLASADTRPEGGDSTKIEAPFTGGAVPKADAQTTSRSGGGNASSGNPPPSNHGE